MNETSRGFGELTAAIFGCVDAPFVNATEPRKRASDSISRQHDHLFSSVDVGEHLVRLFYSFVAHPDTSHHFLPAAESAKPLTSTFRLHEAQRAAAAGDGPAAAASSSSVCGHIFAKGEAVYRCRDCALDDTCVLCSACFDEAAHAGHNVSYSIHSSGGCCDCGDVEAWKLSFPCPLHAAAMVGDEAVVSQQTVIPPAVVQHLTNVVDFILEILALAPEMMLPPRSPADVRRQMAPGEVAGPLTTGRGPWSCVLWNDEKHNFGQVIDQVQRAIPTATKARATAVAVKVDAHGRETILTSSNAETLYSVASIIASIELAVTVRSALVTFCEDVVGCFITFIKDLCQASYDGDPSALGLAVAHILLRSNRFERLLVYDSRLWKSARQQLQELYIRLLLLNAEIKGEMGAQFCRMYPHMVEAFLLNDREPDYSMITFGVQVLTVPSIVMQLINPPLSHQVSFLDTLVDILTAFLAEQITENNVDPPRSPRHLVLPPRREGLHFDPDSASFKQKRYFHVLHDLSRLLESPAAKVALPANPHRIRSFVAFLDLFTGMHPSTRAAQQHVEYESDTWIAAFNATIQISRLARFCGEAFREASSTALAQAMHEVYSPMTARLLHPHNPALWHHMSWCGRRYRLVNFEVAAQPVSFHHPLQWLYAELAKNLNAFTASGLTQGGFTSLEDLILGRDLEGEARYMAALAGIEAPLQTCALLAQVRAGVWVRNGFTMRIQSMHYREYSLRETTFDQDVSMLQLWVAAFGPDTVLAALLDRFDLAQWLQLHPDNENSIWTHASYALSQCIAVLDDLISLLITIISEVAIPAGWSFEQRMRREIVHFLAVGQCPLSELSKRVAEIYIDDASFERTLMSVAAYRPPASTNDHGMYALRSEYMDEVDPYYYRYSRNQRDEAKRVVLAHLARQPKNEISDVVVPRPVAVDDGVFATRLVDGLTSDVFIELVFHTLRRSVEADDADHTRFSEPLIDQTLHLVVLAIVNRRQAFCEKVVAHQIAVRAGEPPHLAALLVKLENDTRLANIRPKLRWCLDQMAQVVPNVITPLRKSIPSKPASLPVVDQKKAAAQARQAAVMKQFANMQHAFLNSELAAGLDDGDEAYDEATMEGGRSKRKTLGTCIVCQEGLDGSKEPFGILGLIQSSRLLRGLSDSVALSSFPDLCAMLQIMPQRLDAPVPPIDHTQSLFNGWRRLPGMHASSCGHMMHQRCFDTYCRSVENRHSVQHHRNHPENLDRQEYICPLCKSLGNVLLPVDEGEDQLDVAPEQQAPVRTATWVLHWVDQAVNGWQAHGGRAIKRMLALGGSGDLAAWTIDEDLPVPAKRNNPPPLSVSQAERTMLERVARVVYSLTVESRTEDPSALFLPGELVSYTIRCLEASARGQSHAVVDIPEATIRLMRSLFVILRSLVDIGAGSVTGTEQAAAALSSRMAARDRSFMGRESPSLSLLVAAVAVAPHAFAHFASLTYYDHLAHTFGWLVGAAHVKGQTWYDAEASSTPSGSKLDAECDALKTFARFLCSQMAAESHANAADGLMRFGEKSESTMAHLGHLVVVLTLPMLRQIAIVRRIAFNDAAELARWDMLATDEAEYCRLMAYIGIPMASEWLHDEASTTLRSRFGTLFGRAIDTAIHMHYHSDSHDLGQPFARDGLDYPGTYDLRPLPRRLDLLVASLTTRKCKKCQTTPLDPAICLLCGELVCNQTFCCIDASNEDEPSHGECNTHMWYCGGTIGIYFLVNKPSILYLYADNGSFAPSPYLDEHGEANNKRNLFKYLYEPRWEEIRRNYVNHAIPTFVARKLDSLVDPGGWTTL